MGQLQYSSCRIVRGRTQPPAGFSDFTLKPAGSWLDTTARLQFILARSRFSPGFVSMAAVGLCDENVQTRLHSRSNGSGLVVVSDRWYDCRAPLRNEGGTFRFARLNLISPGDRSTPQL